LWNITNLLFSVRDIGTALHNDIKVPVRMLVVKLLQSWWW